MVPTASREVFGQEELSVLSTLRLPGYIMLSFLAPLPHLHVSTFSVDPMQLGRDDPFCVLLHDPTLIFVVKAFGSVKHEGTCNK